MTFAIFAGGRLGAVTLESPGDITDIVGIPQFVWDTTVDDFMPGGPGHFEVQVASDLAFTTIVRDVLSVLSVTGFEYESAPGVWTALPSDGLPELAFGNRVRYTPTALGLGSYWWRVRVLDQI